MFPTSVYYEMRQYPVTLRVIALCLKHCEKAYLLAYAFSVLICLYLHVGLTVKVSTLTFAYDG